MSEQARPLVKLPAIEQVSLVVRDIDKTMEYYSSVFGIGPFRVINITLEGALQRGIPISSKIKVAFARSGTVQIELIQPLEGENIYTEFLKAKGEGLHHLGFRVDDLDSVLAELAKEGIEPLLYQKLPHLGAAFAYLSSDKVGGVLFELIERRSPGSKKDEQPGK